LKQEISTGERLNFANQLRLSINGEVVKYIYDKALPIIERNQSGELLAEYARIPNTAEQIGLS